MKIATTLTVNWNCKNFRIQSKIFLPYLTAVIMLEKLSSNKIIPAASLATYVPAIPMANPISAFFKAGASFVPSPVIATTFPICFKPVAKVYLSSGEDLARTLNSLTIFLNSSIFYTNSLSSFSTFFNSPTLSLNYFPSITKNSPGSPLSGFSYTAGIILASFAMAVAVSVLSPVTIRTMMPALLQLVTASGIPSFRGSLIPANPSTTKLF